MQGQTQTESITAAAATAGQAEPVEDSKQQIAAKSTADALLTIDEFMQAAWGEQAQRLVA